jgi:hypothetical protein
MIFEGMNCELLSLIVECQEDLFSHWLYFFTVGVLLLVHFPF